MYDDRRWRNQKRRQKAKSKKTNILWVDHVDPPTTRGARVMTWEFLISFFLISQKTAGNCNYYLYKIASKSVVHAAMKVTQERGSLFLPSPKRPRSDSSSASKNDVVPPALAFCQYLLQTSDDHQLPGLPSTLGGAHVREDTAKLKRIFDSNGFRTSLVSSPREALSVYKDSAHLFSDSLFSTTDGKTWLVTLLGMHPNQDELEHFFRS